MYPNTIPCLNSFNIELNHFAYQDNSFDSLPTNLSASACSEKVTAEAMDRSFESLSTSDDSDQYFQDKTNIGEELLGLDGFMNPDSSLETRKDNDFECSLGD